MALKFNGVDLDMIVTEHNAPDFGQEVHYVQLPDVAYAFGATRNAKPISVDVVIKGISYDEVMGKLDTLKLVLNERNTCPLELRADRYYNAVFNSLKGNFEAPTVWVGIIEFLCPDPVAYSTMDTVSEYTIDNDPQSITETTDGTGFISPVYTLEANAPATTVTLENIKTLEKLQWAGGLAAGDTLEIDVVKWYVSKNGMPSMATVSGQFPRLMPATDNDIVITGFKGIISISYRNRWV